VPCQGRIVLDDISVKNDNICCNNIGGWGKISESKIKKIFSAADVKHGLSLFREAEIRAVEKLITEQDDKFLIRCQKKDKLKVAKPEEIVRHLWIYRLMNEYGYPLERIDVEKIELYEPFKRFFEELTCKIRKKAEKESSYILEPSDVR